MKTLVACLLLLGCFAPEASAVYPPQPGVYRSHDLGGPVAPGHDLEGWAPGASLLSGMTVNMFSFVPTDPIMRGGQWKFNCADQSAPAVLIADAVDGNGDGYRTFARPFEVSNSFLFLGSNGPWGGGNAVQPLVGRLDDLTDRVTIRYEGGAPVETSLSVLAAGHFLHFPDYTVTIEIAQGLLLATGPALEVYPWAPAWLYLPDCAPSAPQGAWWDLAAITITINGPPVPVRTLPWGRVKARFR